MFGHRLKLFTVFGFPIQIDLSWVLIAVLVAWSLASGVFPRELTGFSPATYWVMGAVGAVALFACIVLHELGHALMARHYGMRIRGITLFIFGGVGEMSDEPPSARAEFFVSIIGPSVSVSLAAVLYGLAALPWPEPVTAVMAYLALINAIVAGFNLVPAFPLDGGRVLRAGLWRWKGNLGWATRIASRVGSGFGALLMALAVFHLLVGDIIGAVWWFVLGLFVRGSARMSYQQLLWRRLLSETSVRRLMSREPKTVSPEVPIDRFVDEFLYTYHFRMFPVVADGQLVGCVTTDDIKELPREEWANHTVGDVLTPCGEENAIPADADAVTALTKMNQTGNSRLMVVEDGDLVGIITLKDLWAYISRRVELEGGDLEGAWPAPGQHRTLDEQPGVQRS
ncbi:MAG: site-2 protease family protein [bacterium]